MKTKLQIMREKRNLTRRELSELSEVNLRMIQKYEMREKSFSGAAASTFLRIADTLECDPHEIIDDFPENRDRASLIREKQRLLSRLEEIKNILKSNPEE